jgi:hypothetical protein
MWQMTQNAILVRENMQKKKTWQILHVLYVMKLKHVIICSWHVLLLGCGELLGASFTI